MSLKEKAWKNQDIVRQRVKNIFGVANFSFAVKSTQDMEQIKKSALSLLENSDFESFRITTKRSNKNFPLTSPEVSAEVGAYILDHLKDKEVDLEDYDINCFIEIVGGDTFLFLNKFSGPGGLPVGVSSKAVSLISGGIDSPVASFFGMKRGTKIIFVHFHAFPYTSKGSIEKVKKLVRILNQFQFHSRLYLIPFGEIQKKIALNAAERLRIILYRRMMTRIASRITKKENAQALLTGESVGQVSSQTLENMRAVADAADYPFLRPLVSFDKQEVIQKAKQIGTYQVSIEPYEDTCSRFQPDHPETRARLEQVRKEEQQLSIEFLIQQALQEKEVLTINFPQDEFKKQ